MRRLFLAEKGKATNQCCAILPWIEFCNSIGGRSDVAQVLKLPLEPDELNLPIIGENLNRHLELEDVPGRATACLEGG